MDEEAMDARLREQVQYEQKKREFDQQMVEQGKCAAYAGIGLAGAVAGALNTGAREPTPLLLRRFAGRLEKRAKRLRALADELPVGEDSEEVFSDAMTAIHAGWAR